MEGLQLDFVEREISKKARKRLREEGSFPAVVYSNGQLGHNIALSSRQFLKNNLIKEHGRVISLKGTLGGKATTLSVIVKNVQQDFLANRVYHVDFLKVRSGEAVKVRVPIHIVGEAPQGVRIGGILENITYELEIRCFPKDLPQSIDVDLSDLSLGSSFTLADIKNYPKVEFLDTADTVICMISGSSSGSEDSETSSGDSSADGVAADSSKP